MAETLGWEVVVRFYPGAEAEAREFLAGLGLPAQARTVSLYEITSPEGEVRRYVARSGWSGEPPYPLKREDKSAVRRGD